MPTEAKPIFQEGPQGGQPTGPMSPGYLEKRSKWESRNGLERLEALDEERGDAVLPVFLNGRGAPSSQDPYVEKPWHRHAAHYLAAGYTPKQIAKECDVTVQAVRQLQLRPQFQANVTKIIEAYGFDVDVMKQFKAEIGQSLQTLVDIRDDVNAPKAVRANIAFGILERVLGKATQKVEFSGNTNADPVAEWESIENQNKSMREGRN